jgi:predicted amidophosphoribosyltransferase
VFIEKPALSACAKVLKNAGAREVRALTVAIADRHFL